MNLLLLITAILANILEYQAFPSAACSNVPNEMHSQPSQPELTRVTREDHPYPEPLLWGNPCNYADGTKPSISPDNMRDLEIFLHLDIMRAQNELIKYTDTFARGLFDVQSFRTLVEDHQNEQWLRAMPWMTDDILLPSKKIFDVVSNDKALEVASKFKTVAPKLHKATKMILAGLRQIAFYGICSDAMKRDNQLRPNLDKFTRDVRTMLCRFSGYLDKLGVESEWMYQLEEPSLYKPNLTFLIYRDAIDYLEYLGQVVKVKIVNYIH